MAVASVNKNMILQLMSISKITSEDGEGLEYLMDALLSDSQFDLETAARFPILGAEIFKSTKP